VNSTDDKHGIFIPKLMKRLLLRAEKTPCKKSDIQEKENEHKREGQHIF